MRKCLNCGRIFNENVMDWKDLKYVKCPYCGSRCVRRLFKQSLCGD